MEGSKFANRPCSTMPAKVCGARGAVVGRRVAVVVVVVDAVVVEEEEEALLPLLLLSLSVLTMEHGGSGGRV